MASERQRAKPVAIVIAGVVLLLLLAIAALRPAPVKEHTIAEHDRSGEHSQGQVVYTCSMHPQIRSHDPHDTCPICGMALIPVTHDDFDEQDTDSPILSLSPRAVALMDIQTWPVERAPAEKEVRLFGMLEHNERNVKTVAAWTAGRVEDLRADFTGKKIEVGQEMLKIYSPALISAQEELLQSLSTLKTLEEKLNKDALAVQTAQAGLRASREKLYLLGLSEAQVAEIEKRGRVLDHLPIPAPLSGTVIEKHVNKGDYVSVGDPLFTVSDLTSLWLNAFVFESDISAVHHGQALRFETPSFAGRSFIGRVVFIDPVITREQRAVRIRVDVENPTERLKPGMFAAAVLKVSLDRDGRAILPEHEADGIPLLIPATAPLITGERAVVYVRLPDRERPTFEGRQVVLGPRAGSHFVVREGLSEGELVVVNGNFKIDSELQIRGQPSMMQPEGGFVMPTDHDH